ncbi:DNA cytosine methyltransferase [Desulfobacter vibrioformis]|uniref:DNA cytosine methyltransferase n=1 Tax=Desulfobacter vibrioformis TaxID=34031 RepID=UPI0009FE2AC5|nr:DNA (cytosine-5-)-methyltransferase [Desulfobacter vibrioformis]
MKNFIEFFAGVGLVREGLNNNNWSCIWANDISPDKQESYVKNFGDNHFWLGDIWDIANNSDLVPNNAFLYTASFPCTDLSVAGARAGLAGAESGTLNALLEIIKYKKTNGTSPKVILLENVKGFLTSHKGKDVADIVKSLSDLGYFIDIIELDAIDFSAQSRPRVFLIAVEESLAINNMIIKSKKLQIFNEWWSYFEKYPSLRSDKIKKIILDNEQLNWALFNVELPQKSTIRLSDIIETDIPDDSEWWWNEKRQKHIYDQMSDNHKLALKEMIKKKHYSYGTVYRRMRNGKSMAELRNDGYAGCLRTPRGGSSKQILIKAGKGHWKVRLLTPREYARLQGVRDSFQLPKNVNKGYFAMGDGVCVPVIEYIANNILDPLYFADNTSN